MMTRVASFSVVESDAMGERKGFMKRVLIISSLILIAAAISASPVTAQEMMIYPAKGQSAEQQQKDKGECMQWASQQSGFNPTAALAPTSAPPPAQAPVSSGRRGLKRGAVTGAAVGAIAGDAGKGAAIGATSGVLFGGMKRRDEMAHSAQQQQAWASEQADNYAQKQSAFNRAYSACLTGRGYTVN